MVLMFQSSLFIGRFKTVIDLNKIIISGLQTADYIRLAAKVFRMKKPNSPDDMLTNERSDRAKDTPIVSAPINQEYCNDR